MKKNPSTINSGEHSFSLVETIVAIGLLVVFVVEVAGVQGNAVYFAEYGRRSLRAMWLARSLMAKVEYAHATRPFSDLSNEETDAKFEEFPDYTYNFSIQDWKLPVAQLLGAAPPSEGEEDGPEEVKSEDPITAGISQVLGDDLFKIAHVEVFWAEGALRNSVTLTYLVTNQRKIDEFVGTQKAVFDSVYKNINSPTTSAPGGKTTQPPASPSTPSTPSAGTPGGGT